MTTGRSLFLLDVLAMALVWPILLNLGCWEQACFRATPDALASILYPLANLVSLYALGLYRRDAMIDTRGSLSRVPLAVSLGALGTACLLVVVAGWTGSPENRVRLFAGAVIGFSVAAAAPAHRWCRHPRLGFAVHAAQ
jgi:hypothetical protein